jgi:hypothetical protein
MALLTIARISSIAAAIVWALGLPLVAISAFPFSSDPTYFLFGLVSMLVGLAAIPIALAYPGPSPARLTMVVRVSGAIASLTLVLTGTVLVSGAVGFLGDRAPLWITDASLFGLLGFFAWILLASYSTRTSNSLGGWVFWLGLLAGVSVPIPILVSLLLSFLEPSYTDTNATIPFVMISALATWLCLPAWLVALSLRMPSRHLAQTNS